MALFPPMSPPPLKGVFTALVTPFRDGAVDEAAFVRLVERQIAGRRARAGARRHHRRNGDPQPRRAPRVVELCVKTAAGRVPVIAGAGSNSTAEAIELARHAKAVGADAALMVTAYYNRPSQEGLYRHYAAVDDAVDLPVLVYNVPARTSVDISNETLARLAEAAEHHRHQGRHRRHGAGQPAAAAPAARTG